MHKAGKPIQAIGKELNVSKTCVAQTVDKFKKTGTVADAPRSGRPRTIYRRQDRALIMKSKTNRRVDLTDLSGEM